MRPSAGAESTVPSRWPVRIRQALGLLVLIGVIGLWVSSYLSTRTITVQNKEYRKSLAGLQAIVDPVDLSRHTDGQVNAADEYLRLHELVVVREARVVELRREPDGTVTPESWSRFERWVQDSEPLIRLASDAAKKPVCAFPRDWSLGYRLQFPEFTTLRTATRMVLGAAAIHARSKDWEACFRYIGVAKAIVEHLRQEPGVLAAVTSSGCENYVYTFLQPLIHRHGAEPEFARHAEAFLSKPTAKIDLLRAIRQELAIQLATIERISDGTYSFESLNNPRTSRKSPFDFLFKFDYHRVRVESLVLGRHLAFFRETANLPPRDLPDALYRIDRSFGRDRSTYGRIVAMLVPGYRHTASLGDLSATRTRLSKVGLWLEGEQKRSGVYPRLLPNKPWATDPYSGKTFVYVPQVDSYRLFSVGIDGEPFTGAPAMGRRMGRNDDVEFHTGTK